MYFDWKNYIEKTKDRGVHRLLKMAMDKYALEPRTFFDVGSGAGNEIDYARSLGFQTSGVDFNSQRADIIKADMAKFDIPESDVIVSINAIPFVLDGRAVLKRISEKAKKMVVVSVFGQDDEWVREGRCISFTEEEVRSIFEGFEIVHLKEMKKRGLDASGRDKNWHIIEFVARRVV